jgi:hypothetical protein
MHNVFGVLFPSPFLPVYPMKKINIKEEQGEIVCILMSDSSCMKIRPYTSFY